MLLHVIEDIFVIFLHDEACIVVIIQAVYLIDKIS